MCLLMKAPSATLRRTLLETPRLLESIYEKNPDGVGVMYGVTVKRTPTLKVIKRLPRSVAGVRRMLEALPNDERDVAVHFRWRTHGDINLEQCHPYELPAGSALMHNGVLHTGNRRDTSKSDTWHFAREFLRDLTPDTMHSPTFRRVLGEFIKDNRFALASSDGRISLVNEDQGVSYEGVWFSNTYAWDVDILDPSYSSLSGWGGLQRWAFEDDEEEDHASYVKWVHSALQFGDLDLVRSELDDHNSRDYFLHTVFDELSVESVTALVGLPEHYGEIQKAVLRGDFSEVIDQFHEHPAAVTEVLTLYTTWELDSSLAVA